MEIKCQSCGLEVSETFKFCPKCGNTLTEINSKASKHRRACDTFEKFKAKKSQQRATFFRGKTKTTAQKVKDVLISIGVMKYDRYCTNSSSAYTPVRGKSLPLKINMDANYAQFLTAALMKRKAYDQSFNEKLDWGIVYPDGQIASSLTGQPDRPFCLRAYKEDLGKNYSRIVLYICTETSDETNVRVEEDTFDRTGTFSDVKESQSMDVGSRQEMEIT